MRRIIEQIFDKMLAIKIACWYNGRIEAKQEALYGYQETAGTGRAGGR